MAQKFLFIVSKGFEKAGGATRALQFAAVVAEEGHHVEVFLLDDGVHWAQFGMADGIHASTGESMKDQIDKLVEHKTPIHVCKACADKRLISPDDLIPGAVLAAAPVAAKMMVDPEYKVFTF